MLVLSRKAGEKIAIGDNITLEVVRISGNRVAIGITAPNSVKILRAELENFGTDGDELLEEAFEENLPGFDCIGQSSSLCEAC